MRISSLVEFSDLVTTDTLRLDFCPAAVQFSNPFVTLLLSQQQKDNDANLNWKCSISVSYRDSVKRPAPTFVLLWGCRTRSSA